MHVIETGFTLPALGMLGIAGRAVFVFFSPYRKCRWCRNRRQNRNCWRCHGTRMTRRFGAKHVHRVRLALSQAWEERR
jgi:hypothetical protein